MGKMIFERLVHTFVMAAMLLSLLAVTRPVQAAAIQVTTLADDDANDFTACSLREAIIAANNDVPYGGCASGNGEDVVYLGSGVYTLSIGIKDEKADALDFWGKIGDLDIRSPIVFIGAGVDRTIIQPAYKIPEVKTRIFHVMDDVKANFQDLNIQGGYAYYAIANLQEPPLETMGGGIYNQAGSVTLNRVRVRGNQARHSGGGVYSDGDARSLNILDSTIQENVSELGDGGGLVNESGMTVAKSLIIGNAAVSGNGGGVYNTRYGRMTAVTVTGNRTLSVNGRGAGIYADNVIEVISSTIVGNQAKVSSVQDPNAMRYGFEIYSGRGIVFSTLIASNTATTGTTSAPANCRFDDEQVGTYNMTESLDSNVCKGTGNLNIPFIQENPAVRMDQATLALNQGRTLSYALPAGSPAIDGGPQTGYFTHPYLGYRYYCNSGDQRWAIRPVDGNGDSKAVCDVGSVESPDPVKGITIGIRLYMPQMNR